MGRNSKLMMHYLLLATELQAEFVKSTVIEARKKGIKQDLLRPITLWQGFPKAFAPFMDKVKELLL